MVEVFKTVNKILRVIFIGFVGIIAITKIFDIKSDNKEIIEMDENDYATSEFDEIWQRLDIRGGNQFEIINDYQWCNADHDQLVLLCKSGRDILGTGLCAGSGNDSDRFSSVYFLLVGQRQQTG